MEDTLDSPRIKVSSHSQFYRESDVIAEDFHEQDIEKDDKHKRSNNSKILDASLDKSELNSFLDLKPADSDIVPETIIEDANDAEEDNAAILENIRIIVHYYRREI